MATRKVLAVWCAVLAVCLLTGVSQSAKRKKKQKKEKKVEVKKQDSRDDMIKRFCNNKKKDYEILGFAEQKDDILDRTYSFLVFQESQKGGGESVVWFTSNWFTGAKLDEKAVGKLRSKASKEGAEYVTIGSPFVPPRRDKRIVEYRYYPDKKMVEVFAAFRDFKKNRKKPVTASGYPSSWGGSSGEAMEEAEEKTSETAEKVKEKDAESKGKELKEFKKKIE